jgi:hypothetical protein
MDTDIVASVRIAACAGTCHRAEMQGFRKETCTWQGDQEPQGMCEVLRRRELGMHAPIAARQREVLMSQRKAIELDLCVRATTMSRHVM